MRVVVGGLVGGEFVGAGVAFLAEVAEEGFASFAGGVGLEGYRRGWLVWGIGLFFGGAGCSGGRGF